MDVVDVEDVDADDDVDAGADVDTDVEVEMLRWRQVGRWSTQKSRSGYMSI